MKKLKKTAVFVIAAILAVFSLTLIPASTYAADSGKSTSVCDQSGVPNEVKKANGCKDAGSVADISDVVVNIVDSVIGILGIVAVVFIVIGGVNYMTSTGDAAKVQKAKNTILYAAIGLIICALSFAIVNFVIFKVISEPKDYNDDQKACEAAGYVWHPEKKKNKCKES